MQRSASLRLPLYMGRARAWPLVSFAYCVFALASLYATTLAHAQSKGSAEDWSVYALLGEADRFDAARVSDAVRARLRAEDNLGDIKVSPTGLELSVGKGSASIVLQASPLPATEVQEACRHAAWHWRSACDTTNTHQAHVRVTLRDSLLRKVDSAVLVTRLLAAVTAESGALATLWGSNLQSVEVFQRNADSLKRERVPTLLWISYRYTREASGNVSVLTRGMGAFELMEIESRDTPFPGRDLVEIIVNASQRLIMKGAVIGDGETIGGPPGRRVHVRFADSLWTPGRRVYRVEIGT